MHAPACHRGHDLPPSPRRRRTVGAVLLPELRTRTGQSRCATASILGGVLRAPRRLAWGSGCIAHASMLWLMRGYCVQLDSSHGVRSAAVQLYALCGSPAIVVLSCERRGGERDTQSVNEHSTALSDHTGIARHRATPTRDSVQADRARRQTSAYSYRVDPVIRGHTHNATAQRPELGGRSRCGSDHSRHTE